MMKRGKLMVLILTGMLVLWAAAAGAVVKDVTVKSGGTVLQNTQIDILNEGGQVVATRTTDLDGKIILDLPEGNYVMRLPNGTTSSLTISAGGAISTAGLITVASGIGLATAVGYSEGDSDGGGTGTHSNDSVAVPNYNPHGDDDGCTATSTAMAGKNLSYTGGVASTFCVDPEPFGDIQVDVDGDCNITIVLPNNGLTLTGTVTNGTFTATGNGQVQVTDGCTTPAGAVSMTGNIDADGNVTNGKIDANGQLYDVT